ncbi:MAG TPA: LD-carboxypeptidase, partial [Bacillaceae bacterium]
MAVKGKALAKGEKIGLTAPAGPVGQERLGQAVLVLDEMGFKVEIGFSCRQKYQEYLAGKPEDR